MLNIRAEAKKRREINREDYSAAAQSMLLAAVSLGYASLWLDSPYFDGAK